MTATEPQKRLERLPVAEVTFAIPAQKFAVTCAITTQETLPVVTEFSIRMIHACGTMSPEQLQNFFGFTEKETAAVIGTLLDERLVRWDDDQLGLTPQALALFLESVDNVPRCFRIQEWSGDVYFELISLSPIKRSRGSGRSRALIDLRPADHERESRTRYWGERAFQEHFRTICRKERAEIYKISEMEPGERLSVPLSVTFSVSLDGRAELRRSLSDVTLEERIDFSTAISDELAQGTQKNNNGLQPLLDRFRITMPNECTTDGNLDLPRYLDYTHVLGKNPFGDDTKPLIGALYLPDNRKTITGMIKLQREINEATGHGPTLNTPMCWLAPDVSFWGRTTAARAFVREIERSTKPTPQATPEETEELPETQLALRTLLQPGRVPDQRSRIAYRTAIPGAMELASDVLDGKTEVFWVPGVFVVVLYHFHLDGPIPVPIGFFSTNAEHLAIARNLIVNEVLAKQTVYDLSNTAGGIGKDCTESLECFKYPLPQVPVGPPSHVRVNILARELGIKANLILDYLSGLGIKKTHSGSVTKEMADQLREIFRGRS